ncbi:MAG TPA: multicopper oxidase domain-containing protein [Planctomycetota bacterium]
MALVSLCPAQTGQAPQLPGSAIAQFVDPLPQVHITAATNLTLAMREFKSPVMPTGFVPATGTYTGTWVWGYRDAAGNPSTTYVGPVVLATRNVRTTIRWRNELPHTSQSHLTAWLTSTDQTLHWADPLNTGHTAGNYSGSVPTVPHLHGGEVPPHLDGGPDAWFTSDGAHHGGAYHSFAGAAANEAIYRYPNTQEAANIWFHDHALGITRLNVYAGLAGGYLLADPQLSLPAGLTPHGIGTETIVPLVIQDRKFDVNGQLFFDNVGINPEHPYWVPEFVGDTIVVTGKVWPTFGTAAAPKPSKRYRFLFVNGSNARTYELFLVDAVTGANGPPMWVIGTDGGYLDRPVKIDPSSGSVRKLTMMPGERYDVIVDFNDPNWRAANPQFSGRLLLRNTGRAPFPFGAPPQGSTLGRILKLFIGPPVADSGYNPASSVPLRAPMVRLVNPTAGTPAVTPYLTRQLTLNEVMGPGGPMEVLVNNTRWNGLSVATDIFPGGVRPDSVPDPTNTTSNYLTEFPLEGSTELWEIVNMTADAHPLHLHLVQFQLMNRQRFRRNYVSVYDALFPPTAAVDSLTGLPHPGGVFVGGFGPPLHYLSGAPDRIGGNPDVNAYLQGPTRPPYPHERGWKDTVVVMPGEVTRLMVRWAPTSLPTSTPAAQRYFPFDPDGNGGYVWHCHIIDHEDNEMMRGDVLQLNTAAPAPAARPLRLGVHY